MGKKMNDLKIGTLNQATASQDVGTASYGGNDSQQVTIFNPYGLVTCAPKDSRLILIPLNGNESNMYALVDKLDRGEIPTPKAGETILANYLTGSFIHLKEDGIEIFSDKDMNVKVKNFTVDSENFSLDKDGNLKAKTLKSASVDVDTHTHGGVQTGGDTSGPPSQG